MTREEMIWTAGRAIDKRMDYETLKYSDYMYGKEDLTDEVWKFVEECEQYGQAAFYKKYADELK